MTRQPLSGLLDPEVLSSSVNAGHFGSDLNSTGQNLLLGKHHNLVLSDIEGPHPHGHSTNYNSN